jgi:hypothetical protein
MVALNPKFTPDARSIMLFGPGVTEVTKAKPIKAIRISMLMRENLNRIRRAWKAEPRFLGPKWLRLP